MSTIHFVVEHNVEIPKIARSFGDSRNPGTRPLSPLSDAIQKLEVGQSILLRSDEHAARVLLQKAGNAARNCSKRTEDGRKFVCRTVEHGVRIWRTE